MRTQIIFSIILLTAAPLHAQAQRQLTAADYQHAEQFLGNRTNPLVTGVPAQFSWLPDGRFWYRSNTPAGLKAFVVDVTKKTREAFEPPRSDSTAPRPPRNSIVSPDGKRAAFIRDYNLWVKDLASGAETQLTTDGIKDYGYATNNAGWVKSDEPVLNWSPDSKKIATFQHDQRGTSMMYLASSSVGQSQPQAWHYPLPGDSVIFRIRRVFIDVDNKRVMPFQMPVDQHRSTICDHISCNPGEYTDTEWFPDAASLAFVSVSRDHKVATLRVAEVSQGRVRDVLTEKVATQFESGISPVGTVNWRVLAESNEVLWWSQRSDWGHLYLYDLKTGALKRAVTQGAWNVADVLKVDAARKWVWVLGVGREMGRDPYFIHLYKVSMDGKKVVLLTPENATHNVKIAPDGTYFVDTYSTPTQPPVTVVRDMNGKLLMELEKADVSKLVAKGWKPPTPIVVKARDGKTDLYGLMFTPTQLDSTKKYPIINYIYPGPQTGSVGSRAFAAARGDHQALADLGFIVVAIDGMGTPWRSKTFQDAYYGKMADNTLPDQVAGMKELAQRYSFIDIDKAGIWGHSGGGFATASAMFQFPEFFKVGISESGNHDNRNYEDDWGERYQGLMNTSADSAAYRAQANQINAKNLRGKLMLAHGGVDDNVPPYNTYLVVDELIKANKDFDLVILPNQRHGYGSQSNYMMRRRWDYFVKNLMGAEPPVGYEIGAKVVF